MDSSAHQRQTHKVASESSHKRRGNMLRLLVAGHPAERRARQTGRLFSAVQWHHSNGLLPYFLRGGVPQGALKCVWMHEKDQFMFTPTTITSDEVCLQPHRILQRRGGGVLRMCGLSICLSCGTTPFSFLKAVGSRLKDTRARTERRRKRERERERKEKS